MADVTFLWQSDTRTWTVACGACDLEVEAGYLSLTYALADLASGMVEHYCDAEAAH